MAILFTDCSEEHLPGLEAFWGRVYRPNYILRKNESLFRWQFGRNPKGKASDRNLRLAIQNGRVAACLGFIPVEVQTPDKRIKGAWVVNWMVDPCQRGLGLGPRLMRQIMDRFDVTLNVGPNQEAQNVLVRMGWTNHGALPRYICILNSASVAALCGADSCPWPNERRRQDQKSGRDATIETTSSFDESVTRLWQKLSAELGAGTARSAEYLNWRYAAHPEWKYRCLVARHSDGVAGVAIYRIEAVSDYSVRIGRIVEFFAEPRVEDALLDQIVEDALAAELAFLDFFCSSPRVESIMRRHGFVLSGETSGISLPVLFQPLDRKKAAFHFMASINPKCGIDAPARWCVTKGDGDQDRPN